MDYDDVKSQFLFLMGAAVAQYYDSALKQGVDKSDAIKRAMKEAGLIRRVIAPDYLTVFDYVYWEFLETSCIQKN